MSGIQVARAADAAELSDFAVASYRDTFGALYDPADLASFLAGWNTPPQLRAQIADAAWHIALVRSGDGAVAGFAKLGPVDFDLPPGQPHDRACELHNLYVAPQAKGTGIAAALMDWVIDAARATACILYLSVFTDNLRAQAFYRRYGFVDVGRNAFRVGNQIDEDRIWRLDL